MNPAKLIGLPYRLGANPADHGAADCLSLCRSVLEFYGIDTPEPKRSWYRRLKRGDTDVFAEELAAWGQRTVTPRIGVVGLCLSDNGAKGMAVFWENGWLAFVGKAVKWCPIGALLIDALYCPQSKT